MGPAEAIAAVAFAGVIIAFLCVACTGFTRWVGYKQRKVEVEAEANRARLVERSDYVGLLEERVRVLERIVTDRGAEVAQQIENLRDRSIEEKA
jgi:hypothetical protein